MIEYPGSDRLRRRWSACAARCIFWDTITAHPTGAPSMARLTGKSWPSTKSTASPTNRSCWAARSTGISCGCMTRCARACKRRRRRASRPRPVGLDTWGVDFGLLDRNGVLLRNPVHYRDRRTEGMPEAAYVVMPRRRYSRIRGWRSCLSIRSTSCWPCAATATYPWSRRGRCCLCRIFWPIFSRGKRGRNTPLRPPRR